MNFKLFFDTLDSLTPALKRGEIDRCSDHLERQLRKLEITPFHTILDLAISNSTRSVATHFDQFFERESARFEVRAAYTELNDFNINSDRWYCDLFAFDFDGGQDDHDWLSHWKSETTPDCKIKGLESLQAVFASDAFSDSRFENARILCEVLVVVKFQQFVRKAMVEMKKCRFPLYASAHDYDFIARLSAS